VAIAENCSRIEFVSSLPEDLYPYHPDSKGRTPALLTNGSFGKVPFAEHIGLRCIQNPLIKQVTSAAEDLFQKENNQDGVTGDVYHESGIPMVLALAAIKLEAGAAILEQDGTTEPFFTTDTTYRLRNHDGRLDLLIHKPKTEEDIATLAQILYEASLSDDVDLSSITGIARLDEGTNAVELYSVESQLGAIKPFDMSVFINRLRENQHISMGHKTFEAVGTLVAKRDYIPTHVVRYSGGRMTPGGIIYDEAIHKLNERTIEMSGQDPIWMQLAGNGFIPR